MSAVVDEEVLMMTSLEIFKISKVWGIATTYALNTEDATSARYRNLLKGVLKLILGNGCPEIYASPPTPIVAPY